MKRWVRSLAVVASATVVAATIAACSNTTTSDTEKLSITMAGPASWGNWDPVEGGYLAGNVFGYQPVYEGLITLDNETLDYVPLLASAFEISDDRRTMTFTMREGVEFSDGEPLTPEAIKKSFDMIFRDGEGELYAAVEMKEFEPELEVTGDSTFRITTSNGINPRFLDALVMTPIVSPAALDDLASLDEHPVGTGPYTLGEVVPDVSTTFEANPSYWNPDAVDFASVTSRQFEDSVAAANALKSGQIDVAQLDIAQATDVEEAGFTVATGGGQVGMFVWMDRDGSVSPAIADVRVRHAISHAFDRQGILDSLNLGFGRVSSQTFVEGQPQYIEGGDDRYPYDVEKARDLMAEAGYPDGFDLTIPGFSGTVSVEPLVIQTLAEIGIRVTFERFEDADVSNAIISGEYPLVYLATVPSHGLIAWISENQFFNSFGPADPIVADLTDRMDNGDAEERAEAAQEFGELILGEAWYIPISWKYDAWASIPGIEVKVGNRTGWPIDVSDIVATD